MEGIPAVFQLMSLMGTLPLLVAWIWFSSAKFILLGLWALTLVFSVSVDLLQRAIACPVCGYRPSRSRRTGRSLNDPQVADRLLKLEECPVCAKESRQNGQAGEEPPPSGPEGVG